MRRNIGGVPLYRSGEEVVRERQMLRSRLSSLLQGLCRAHPNASYRYVPLDTAARHCRVDAVGERHRARVRSPPQANRHCAELAAARQDDAVVSSGG
jgi:hypothetical protein